MDRSSFFSKAKLAFHNAATKAELALSEFKADVKSDLAAVNTLISDSVKGNDGQMFPWMTNGGSTKCHENELRKCILELLKFPEDFLLNPLEEEHFIVMPAEMQVAKDILEYDEDLRNLWFSYVPKKMEEQEFWRRYFAAVNQIKQGVLNAQDRRKCGAFSEDYDEKNDTSGHMKKEILKKDSMDKEEHTGTLSASTILSSNCLRSLASAIEFGKSVQKMKHLKNSRNGENGFSHGPDWLAFMPGLTVVKKFSRRDRNKIDDCILSLFESDKQSKDSGIHLDSSSPLLCSKFLEEINGAPPGSFVAQLAEIMASLKTPQSMGECWAKVLLELRHRWDEGEPIPKMPIDANPDLRFCVLYQQLQFINCCIARKKRRASALASLNALDNEFLRVQIHQSENVIDSNRCLCTHNVVDLESASKEELLYAKGSDGSMILRKGVDRLAGGLRMLETGELVYSPITQEGPVLTELMIKERDELILSTGSVGAGCSHLLSDMQAFKAANPGCILEDFIRWYSPPDWKGEPTTGSLTQLNDPETNDSVMRGSLSARMRSQGNLWQELWASAKPVPAALQVPLFDEDVQVEYTLDELAELQSADLFEQLFRVALGVGVSIAELSLVNEVKECKEYILSTCCTRGIDSANLEHLCQVYELMEKNFTASLYEF